MSELNFIESALLNPNVIAFLAMIRKAEGTDGPEGYNYLFGSTAKNNLRFTEMDKHPNIRQPFRDTYSTAAGAYQIMHKTDDDLSAKLGLTDFHPRSQDIKAVALLSQKNCLQKLMDGDFTYALDKARKIWASLPGAGYDQPERTVATVSGWYKDAGGEIA